jgi:dipeptidyl-peptidase-4
MTDMMWFEPATTETVPSAYYVPLDATKAIELLKAQGLQMKEAAVAGPVEAFTIKTNNAGQTFEGHAMRTVDGAWGALPKISGDAKYLEVRTDQPLGRLAFYLLEPASDDGLVAWNYLDDQLKSATLYPILRRK